MNTVFGCQIAKPVWLVLAGVVTLSGLGCGDTDQVTLPQRSESVAKDRDPGPSEFDRESPQLRALIAESMQAVEQGNLDEAIENYTSILRHSWSNSNDSDEVKALNAEALQLRGVAFLEKGFPQIAMDDFDDAIWLGEDELDAKTLVLRAMAAAKLNRWSQAAADCGQAIRLDPTNGKAYWVRGQALSVMGQSNRAEESILQAKRLGYVSQTSFKPSIELAPSVLARAKLSLDAGNPGVASEILKKAILEGGDSWETRGLLAQAQFQSQEFYQAVDASTRAIELNPQFADAYRIRGLSQLQRNNLDQAIADLKAALALDQNLAEQLNPELAEARRRGGIDPIIRSAMTSRIRKLVASEIHVLANPGPAERWLLDLIAKSRSSDQVEQFRKLLAATTEAEFDSLDWLADFLMLDYRVPAVKEMRNYLDRKPSELSKIENRLWESVKSNSAAAVYGVNEFPDLAAYAIEYGYLDLLRRSIDWEICYIKFDHVYRSINNESTDCLRMILPHVHLLFHEIQGLLRYCIEKDQKSHAMLLINRYEESLSWELIEFLELAD